MDSSSSLQNQQPSTSTNGPQIRSRITVVCAECKRLKLKCDRRNPCASCTKRDTVPRCIYSPAAAEKVDLHSLNNRLIHVESILALITAGQTPPPFVSSYPFSQPPQGIVPSSHPLTSHPHTHHHHLAAHSGALADPSFTLNPDDLTTIWLPDLELDIHFPFAPSHSRNRTTSVTASSSNGTGMYIKPEPPHLELSLPPPPATNTISIEPPPTLQRGPYQHSSPHANHQPPHPPTSRSSSPQTPGSSRRSIPSSSQVHQRLPPLSAYYTSHSHAFPHSTRPRVTATLREFLRISGVDRYWTQGVNALAWWGLSMGSWGNEFQDRLHSHDKAQDKMRERRRAHEIMYGGTGSSYLPPDYDVGAHWPQETAEVEDGETVPHFAARCAVLALGALRSSTMTTDKEVVSKMREDAQLFYALSTQAVGVWASWVTIHNQTKVEEDEQQPVLAGEGEGREEEKESDELDHIEASVVQVVFLLYDSYARRRRREMATVFSLVGKIVNAARSLRLGDAQNNLSRSSAFDEHSEMTLLQDYRHTVASPLQDRRCKLWSDVLFLDLFVSDTLSQHPLIAQESQDSTNAYSASGLQSNFGPDHTAGKGDCSNAGEDPSNPSATEQRYNASRDRLTRLARRIRHLTANPSCCCGYTLDQASALENDIHTWYAHALGVPTTALLEQQGIAIFGESDLLELDSVGNEVNKEPRGNADATESLRKAELTVWGCKLLLKVWVPFLKCPPPGSNGGSGGDGAGCNVSWSPPQQAVRATMAAARGIVRATKIIMREVRKGALVGILEGVLYPLEDALSRAVVICAHAAFVGSNVVVGKGGAAGGMLEDVVVGLGLIEELGGPNGDQMVKIVQALRAKVEGVRGGVLKRKHDEVEKGPPPTPPEVHPTGTTTTSIDLESNGSNGSTLEYNQHHRMFAQNEAVVAELPETRAPSVDPPPATSHSSRKSSPRAFLGPAKPSSSIRGTEKDKKPGKKTHSSHPAVGIRIRYGKDGQPLFPFRAGSTSKSSSAGSVVDGGADSGDSRTMMAAPSFSNGSKTMGGHVHTQPSSPALESATYPRNGNPLPSIPTQASTSSLAMAQDVGNVHRSRSSSVSHQETRMPPQTMQPVGIDFSLTFGSSTSEQDGQGSPQRRRFSLADPGHKQPQQLSPHHGSFTSSPTSIFDSVQSRPFDQPLASHSYDHSRASFDATSASGDAFGSASPYHHSSGPISSASSPYTNNNPVQQPQTPTFGQPVPALTATGMAASSIHHPSPPTFGPQPLHVSSHQPHHTSHQQQQQQGFFVPSQSTSTSAYGALYDSSGLESVMMGMDATSMDESVDGGSTLVDHDGSIPGTPLMYDKTMRSHGQGKQPPMDSLLQRPLYPQPSQAVNSHQHQHQQLHHRERLFQPRTSDMGFHLDDSEQQQHEMSMAMEQQPQQQTWMQSSHQQQQIHPVQTDYWAPSNNGYKYYSP